MAYKIFSSTKECIQFLNTLHCPEGFVSDLHKVIKATSIAIASKPNWYTDQLIVNMPEGSLEFELNLVEHPADNMAKDRVLGSVKIEGAFSRSGNVIIMVTVLGRLASTSGVVSRASLFYTPMFQTTSKKQMDFMTKLETSSISDLIQEIELQLKAY